jgi:hypothetical protein
MEFAHSAPIITTTTNEKVSTPPRCDDWIIVYANGTEIRTEILSNSSSLFSLQGFGALSSVTNEKINMAPISPSQRCDAWIIQIANGKEIRIEILPRSIPLLSLQEIGCLPFGSYYKETRRLDPLLSLEDNGVRNEDLIFANHKRSVNVKVRGNFSSPDSQETIDLFVPSQGEDIKLLLLQYYPELEYDSFVLKREDKVTNQMGAVADEDIEDGDVLVMTH